MTPQDFVYWLNGFVELQNPEELTKEQWQAIKAHLAITTNKVTPSFPVENPVWQQPPVITC